MYMNVGHILKDGLARIQRCATTSETVVRTYLENMAFYGSCNQ